MAIILPLIFSINMSWAEICRPNLIQQKKNNLIDNERTKIIEAFSLNPLVRKESETALSLFIKNKSPFVQSFIEKRNLNPAKDPEKVALEWDKYFASSFILSKYPYDHGKIDVEIEKTFDSLIGKLIPQSKVNDVQKIFELAKQTAIAKIQSLSIEDKNKLVIQNKIKAIRLYIPQRLKDSKFEKFPMEFMQWSLAYDPKLNEINFGLNALKYNSTSLTSALLHEIAHSFDPCRWNLDTQEKWPFEKVGECLRTFAKRRDDHTLDLYFQNKKISEADYKKIKSSPTCLITSSQFRNNDQADQLPETFADWFSAYSMPENLINEDFRNDLCEQSDLSAGSSYLSNSDRLNKIYLNSPQAKKILKTKSDAPFCEL